MNTMMKMGVVTVAIMLAGSSSMAQYRGDYHGGRGDYGRSYHGSYDGGRHCGYYRNGHGDWVFGLLGLGIAAAVVSTLDRPAVYVQQPQAVVYQTPQVVYVQPAPPQPTMMTISLQNSNGSFTPVTIHQVGAQWVGPRGEYYDGMPSVGQLRPAYGF